jgi:ribosomal protein S18 acetylase RimI-like enzyme
MKIREASIADIEGIVNLHYRSFKPEDHVPMMLGKDYLKATYKWLLTSNKSYVLVAEIENSVAGLIAVCDGPFFKPMFIACFPEFLKSLIMNPSRIFSKILWRRLFRSSDDTPEKAFLLKAPGFAQMTIGAVDSSYRGKGIFGALVEATKEISKSRRSKALGAGIYKKNSSSRRVFIKAGWKQMDSSENDDTVFYFTFLDDEFEAIFNEASKKNN